MTEITAKLIQKYLIYSLGELKTRAEKRFNKWIRNRDSENCCISCGKFTTLQAGHFYSAGHYPELRYNEKNVNGQCNRCNTYLSGNLLEYRKGLIKKIGIEEVEKLDETVAIYRKSGYKWSREYLITIIEDYK